MATPWVEETPDSRPSKQRCIGRRVTEAETGRGFIAASATVQRFMTVPSGVAVRAPEGGK